MQSPGVNSKKFGSKYFCVYIYVTDYVINICYGIF